MRNEDYGNLPADDPPVAGTPRWYLIQSKPRQDQRAREHLQNQGFRCFLPEINVESRQGQRLVSRYESLFPGYLFIQLSTVADNWLPIRSTRGVLRLVTFADTPLPVADDIVEAIRGRLVLPDVSSRALFQAGERVRIIEGPFANVEAIFECFSGEERVMVLLNILHAPQRLGFPLRSVARQA